MVSTPQSCNVIVGSDLEGGIVQYSSKRARHVYIQGSIEPIPGTSVSEIGRYKVLNLLSLPVEVLETIFGYLSYKNVADLRLVCRKVNTVCCTILNTTFERLQTHVMSSLRSIKAKVPRRDTARRTHPLANEYIIIEAVHIRLNVLRTTFGKHIERRHCCFFAGEILDEVCRILNYVKVAPVPLPCPYDVTNELFDLATMAMEYFMEHIKPTLPEVDLTCFPPHGSSNRKAYMDSPPPYQYYDTDESEDVDSPTQSNMVQRKHIRKIKQKMKRCNSQLSLIRRDLRNCKSRMAVQQKQILEYASRLDETDKKYEETSRKFSTLLQKFNKCKTELQNWRSKSSGNVVCTCGQVLAFVPNQDLQNLVNQGVGMDWLDAWMCTWKAKKS